MIAPKEHLEWQLSLSDEEKLVRQDYFEELFRRAEEAAPRMPGE